MRTLNLIELADTIRSYSNDINYSNQEQMKDKVTQFFTFLHNQSIAKRILENINDDFGSLKVALPNSIIQSQNHKTIQNVKLKLIDREHQGAFGFFIIQQLYESGIKHQHHYLEATNIWYKSTSNYEDANDLLKEYFFKPFIELLQWYIYEGELRSQNDYYSKKEVNAFNWNLEEILQKPEFSNRIIIDEIIELKELILFLNKKNFGHIVKDKIKELVVGEVINYENAKTLFKSLIETETRF